MTLGKAALYSTDKSKNARQVRATAGEHPSVLREARLGATASCASGSTTAINSLLLKRKLKFREVMACLIVQLSYKQG